MIVKKANNKSMLVWYKCHQKSPLSFDSLEVEKDSNGEYKAFTQNYETNR